jgi:signal peptidase II
MNLSKLLLFLSLPLYLLDQATKFWTIAKFPVPWSFDAHEIPVIEHFFYLVRVHNQGVAFGLGNGSAWAPIVFLFVPLVAMTMIRIFWKKGVFDHPLSKIAVALLVCGIFGNLTDRLVQGFLLDEFKSLGIWQRLMQGYVVDFISIQLPFYGRWPAFNVADSCICIAAVLLFIGGIRDEQLAKKRA